MKEAQIFFSYLHPPWGFWESTRESSGELFEFRVHQSFCLSSGALLFSLITSWLFVPSRLPAALPSAEFFVGPAGALLVVTSRSFFAGCRTQLRCSMSARARKLLSIASLLLVPLPRLEVLTCAFSSLSLVVRRAVRVAMQPWIITSCIVAVQHLA